MSGKKSRKGSIKTVPSVFGAKLRALRLRNGLTAKLLAARCAEIDRVAAPGAGYISHLELGYIAVPSPAIVQVLAAALRCSCEWLLNDLPSQHTPPAIPAVAAEPPSTGRLEPAGALDTSCPSSPLRGSAGGPPTVQSPLPQQLQPAVVAAPAGGPKVVVQNDAASGFKAETLAEICKVSIATAHRWKSGDSRMPFAAAALVSGDLGAFGAEWEGWRIQGDAIISPDGWTISRNDALAVPLMHSQLKAYQAELAKYREWDDKDEQPAPPDALPQIVG